MSVPEPPAYGGVPQWPFSPPDAIGWAWRKLTQFLGPVMVGVALYIAFSVLVGTVSVGASALLELMGESVDEDTPLVIADVVTQVVFNVVSYVGGIIFGGAAVRAALDVADGRQYDFINALRRIPVGRLVGAQILLALGAFIVLVALATPFVLAAVLLHASLWVLVPLGVLLAVAFALGATAFQYLLVLVLVDHPTTRVNEAYVTAFGLIRAHIGDVIVLTLLVMLVMLAGLLACVIGVVVAYPISIFAAAHAYRRIRGEFVAA